MPTFFKTPDEVLDYGFNWDEDDGLESAELISTSTWEIPSGLTEFTDDEINSAANQTKCWITDGTDGVDYRIVNTIVTDQARTLERTHIIKVRGNR